MNKQWYSYKVKIYQKDVAFYESGEIQVTSETPFNELKMLMLAKYPRTKGYEVITLDELNGEA